MKPYYEKNGIAIYHGDCREILPEVSADLLLTDPPYGLGAARRNFGGAGVKRHMTGLLAGKCIPKRDYGDAAWDDKPIPMRPHGARRKLRAFTGNITFLL